MRIEEVLWSCLYLQRRVLIMTAIFVLQVHLIYAQESKRSEKTSSLTLSPKGITFRGVSQLEKQTLTLSNPSDVDIKDISPPNPNDLDGFTVNLGCSVIRAHDECKFVISPPAPSPTGDQVASFSIRVGGQTLPEVPLCEPRRGLINAPETNPGILCVSTGECKSKPFHRQGANSPDPPLITGPDAGFFYGSTECLHRGTICQLHLHYVGGSPNAVPEAMVSVHTSCPDLLDFHATVRVVPKHE